MIYGTCSLYVLCCYYCQTEAPCIGFSNLPEQLHRKAIKKGFDFTVMVVGMFHITVNCHEVRCSGLSCMVFLLVFNHFFYIILLPSVVFFSIHL